MSKKFYGVYGVYGGGVYTKWYKVDSGKKYVQGIRYKGFETKNEAVEFVIEGLTKVYGVGEESKLNTEALNSNINFFIYAKDLFSKKDDEEKNSAKQSQNVFEMLQQIQCDLQNLEMMLREQEAEKKTAPKETITIFHSVDYA